jgi:rubredoxin
MNFFMCDLCNYIFEAEAPPSVCPSCREKCTFSNVTCYVPECGGLNNMDPRLIAEKIKESKRRPGSS